VAWLPGDEPRQLLIPLPEASLGAAVLLMIYAYVGFESGLIPGGEAKNPQRDMPRALLGALAVCALLYALLQWICLVTLDDLETTQRPLVELGAVLLGPAGGVLLAVTVITSVGGNLLGSMFSAPRITHALAEDKLLPATLATVHSRYLTPVGSIVVYALLAWLLAATGSFFWLASLSVLTRVLIYVGCIAAMPRVRRQAAPGSLRLPLGWTIPIAAMAVCVLLVSQVTWQSAVATAVMLAVGTALYLVVRMKSLPQT
jgi:amino acid transporter